MDWKRRLNLLVCLYILWSYIKTTVYKNGVANEEDIWMAIQDVFASVTPEVLRKVTASVERRPQVCIEKNGQHFGQYLH